MPAIITQLDAVTLPKAIGYGLLISATLMITRLICTLGASVFTRFMSHFITVATDNPGWREPVVLGWAGMRGVVSLAAALSIPLMMGPNQPFPQRQLILFITFVVILVTLVFQGLTLPWVIKKVNIEAEPDHIPEEKQATIIQRKLAITALNFLTDTYPAESINNTHVANLRSRLEASQTYFSSVLANDEREIEYNAMAEHIHIALSLLNQQRSFLHQMNQKGEFDEDIIRKYLYLLDLEETKLRESKRQETGTE